MISLNVYHINNAGIIVLISNVHIHNAGTFLCPALPLPTLSSSLIFLKATESSYPTTTIQNTGPPPTNSLNSGVIIGIVAGGILVVIIITLTVVIAIHFLMKRLHAEVFHPVSNEAYGIGLQDTAKQVENDSFYDYPTVDHEAIATEQNEAYVTNIETEPSVAYAMNIATEKNNAYEANTPKQVENDSFYVYPAVDHEAVATEQNEAYATNIETEPSVAYAMNITTEKNNAYKTNTPKQVENDTFYDYPTVDHEAIAPEQSEAYI